MDKTCPDPSSCAAVQTQVTAMDKVEKKLDENNKKQEETNLNLARVAGSLEAQNKLLEVYRADTGKDIDALFRLGRKNEIDVAHVEGNIGVTIATEFGNLKTNLAKEIGKVNTAAANKLGIWDVAKIIGSIAGFLTIIAMAIKIFG